VPPRGFVFETVQFSGVRGKGPVTLALLPLRLLKAFWQSLQVVRRVRPDVVIGLGGYISFPAGMMSVLLGKPLVLHEQNSRAGMANRVLAVVADRVFTAFPNVLTKAAWVGNPLREGFLRQSPPADRLSGRSGPLRLLVVGGSLGAQALNDIVPLRANYEAAGVQADLTPFIDDTAQAFADADLVICRAGASTVTELAAIGVAAVYVPFPHAVDDHQTTNARFVVDAGGGWLLPQRELTPEGLATLLQSLDRAQLIVRAQVAKSLQKTEATTEVVAACEALAS
jgi:UDP-N-acetylglucosamine--N-acetylmuramyl-(pentapeptide) pyrophosphoryl-undecaprenol N-acetylglucosamine transferase